MKNNRKGEPPNRLDYADNPAEFEVQKEAWRIGLKNDLPPIPLQ